jgi:hypothetical protein
MHEQAALLQKAGIESARLRFSEGQRRGYGRAQFEEALRNERRPSRAGQLRLISQPCVTAEDQYDGQISEQHTPS